MRKIFSKSSFFFIVILGFCILIYLLILRQKFLSENLENPEEIMLNGIKLADLKIGPVDMPPLDHRQTVQLSMFTVKTRRGIGQILFELAALFGISRKLGRVPVLNRLQEPLIGETMGKMISGGFPLFAANFEERDVEPSSVFPVNLNIRFCCKYEDPTVLKAVFEQNLLINGVYFQSFKYFDDYRSQIRAALTPHPSSAIRAELLIPEEFRKDFLICVHTKQTQLGDPKLSSPSDPFFTRSATDYLVQKYKSSGKQVTVAILGNDPIWAQNLFHDKIGKSNYFSKFNNSSDAIFSKNSPEYTALLTLGMSPTDDVAFSRNFCDVIMLSAPTSSFGWWLAYLAKESAEIYYRDPKEVSDQIFAEMRQIDYYSNSWNKLRSAQLQKTFPENID
ncbi:uncharacterized protein CELE_F58D5.3 [Caenorhabditis elegans]|uniref:Uncharacterized protein n=1 Tax=Caenorhabditis elegans TaxID=6239 RepID=G5EER6_CAEEL|nr:Uncharacterized protein CELE_F58D5.3 [Caenorhabditis elegans]CAB76717.1 Uncharacterized protein CELE_F58D5.3 [Caenorhabditis elegans]|eukprot:NP_493051.1 Uncharacterized protein CELE_F58D5.3 [Caenorhabditis elegans]